LQANEIHYKKDNKTIIVVDTGIIKKIELYKSEVVVFESGFPAIYKNSNQTFYKVMSTGKCSLLCHIEKVFSQSKNEYSGEQTNEFKTYINYYTFINNEMKVFNIRRSIKNR
jgi:hypothetical protein